MSDNPVDATLVIKDAGRMSKARRQEIADWLKMQAASLLKDGDNYAKKFRARFFTNPA